MKQINFFNFDHKKTLMENIIDIVNEDLHSSLTEEQILSTTHTSQDVEECSRFWKQQQNISHVCFHLNEVNAYNVCMVTKSFLIRSCPIINWNDDWTEVSAELFSQEQMISDINNAFKQMIEDGYENQALWEYASLFISLFDYNNIVKKLWMDSDLINKAMSCLIPVMQQNSEALRPSDDKPFSSIVTAQDENGMEFHIQYFIGSYKISATCSEHPILEFFPCFDKGESIGCTPEDYYEYIKGMLMLTINPYLEKHGEFITPRAITYWGEDSLVCVAYTLSGNLPSLLLYHPYNIIFDFDAYTHYITHRTTKLKYSSIMHMVY